VISVFSVVSISPKVDSASRYSTTYGESGIPYSDCFTTEGTETTEKDHLFTSVISVFSVFSVVSIGPKVENA
jgi:hypothetical protein